MTSSPTSVLEDVDTIVVGAGSAGCVVAARLSEDPGRRVVLLEAGGAAPVASTMPAGWPTMFNSEVDWGYYTEPQPGCRGRRIFWPRGRMLGGSGALNAMIYIRGLPSDYDGWAALGADGWSWADVLPWFLRSEHNPRLGDRPLHARGGLLHVEDPPYADPAEHRWMAAAEAAGLPRNDDFNGERQEGVGHFQLTVRGGERWGTASAFLAPARERPNLVVLQDVTVLRVLVEGGRARGVELIRNGRVETLRASSEVVLCAGAIASPQLLLRSGVGPADELRAVGVEVVHDLPGVGKDLQDHINVPITFHSDQRIGLGGMTQADLDAAAAEWESTRSGPFTTCWVAAGAHARSRPDVAEPDLQLYGVISPHRDHARYLAARPGVTLHATLQRPDSRGEIRLRSSDPLAPPVIDPGYFASDADGSDLATLVAGVRLNRRIAAQAPLAELLTGEITPSAEAETDEELGAFVRGHCTTLYHPASSCRMGTDDRAVVDPALRVHGLEGLRVIDASIFPRMVSGNLNAPTIMVAERGAALIRGAV